MEKIIYALLLGEYIVRTVRRRRPKHTIGVDTDWSSNRWRIDLVSSF